MVLFDFNDADFSEIKNFQISFEYFLGKLSIYCLSGEWYNLVKKQFDLMPSSYPLELKR